MPFRIAGLDPEPFAPLFELSDPELAARRARRVVAAHKPGFPCRVSLEDAEPGEELLLLNYEHQPADSPFRSRHAIYVRRNARQPFRVENSLPPVFCGRMLSLRGFDGEGMLVDAELIQGDAAADVIERMFRNEAVACLHAHFAGPGCFAARVDRLPAAT